MQCQPEANHTLLDSTCFFFIKTTLKALKYFSGISSSFCHLYLRVEPGWTRMLPCTKPSSEDVVDCDGSQEPLDSSPQKKCSITRFLKTHAFVLLTLAGIAVGKDFQETFQKNICCIVEMKKINK